MRRTTLILATLMLLFVLPDAASAGNRWLDSSDWHSWELSDHTWTSVQEFGPSRQRDRQPEVGAEQEQDGGGSSILSGDRLKSGGLSLLIPGLGQLRNGQRDKGLIMLGLEAAIWGTYLGFHGHANTLTDDYENWAEIYAGVPGGQTDDFYQSLGRFDNSDDYFDSLRREARAFGEDDPDPLGEDEQWQWRSEQSRRDYQKLRADANSAYDRRDMMVLFAIINRALSIFDAVRNGDRAGRPALAGNALGGEVLGTRLQMEVSSPVAEPTARLTAGWSF